MRSSLCHRLLALAGSFLPALLPAQREQLALRAEQFAGARLTGAAADPAAPTVALRQLTATVGWRTVTGDQAQTALFNGLFYRQSTLSARRGSTPLDRPLHALYYDFLALRTIDDRHTIAVSVRPGLFGTLDHELGEQFRVEGAAFVDRIVGARTTVGLGLSYTSNLGRVLPIPVLHVVHRRGRRVLVDGLLPSRLDVWYYPRRGLELGLNAQLSGFQYFVGRDERERLVPIPAGATGARASDVQLANAIVGPQVRWNPVGKWWLSADAGVTVLRRFTVGTGAREAALEPANAPMVRLGLVRLY